ncbi:hypothetical protein RJT34_03596 [Clitoria ternatea]|uniref:Uncharacterized protein n=1 Tax=Clitoria ternatea TaxID=43366 RepID=A0AAN9Q2N7_CLITE
MSENQNRNRRRNENSFARKIFMGIFDFFKCGVQRDASGTVLDVVSPRPSQRFNISQNNEFDNVSIDLPYGYKETYADNKGMYTVRAIDVVIFSPNLGLHQSTCWIWPTV